METKTLTWSEAIDQAMIPQDLDHKLSSGLFGSGKPRVGEDGLVQDWEVVRTRAAPAYIQAHSGEEAEVTFADPTEANETNRRIFRAHGNLNETYVDFPVFKGDHAKTERGFLVGDYVVPFSGVSSIRVVGDSSVVIL